MSARLQSGDVVHRGETVPDYVLEVGQGCQTWTRDRCGFLLDNPEYPVLRSWTKEDCMTRDYGPATAFSVVRDELGADCAALGLTLSDLLGVGLAVSGPISEKGVVAVSSVLPTWSGVDLSAVFGSLPNPSTRAAAGFAAPRGPLPPQAPMLPQLPTLPAYPAR